MTKPEVISAEPGTRVTAHALHVGDRINTIGFEGEALSRGPARDPGWQDWRRRFVSLRGRGTDRAFAARRKRFLGKADVPDWWEAGAV